jgi:hypothetical protein
MWEHGEKGKWIENWPRGYKDVLASRVLWLSFWEQSSENKRWAWKVPQRCISRARSVSLPSISIDTGRGVWTHSILARLSPSTCSWHGPRVILASAPLNAAGIGRQHVRIPFSSNVLQCSCCGLLHWVPGRAKTSHSSHSNCLSTAPGIFTLRWDPQNNSCLFSLSFLSVTTLFLSSRNRMFWFSFRQHIL